MSVLTSQDVALVELSGSESNSEVEETSDSEEELDSGEEHDLTEQKLRLPREMVKKKANIQVVGQHEES